MTDFAAKLSAIFAEMDKEVAARDLAWAQARMDAIAAFHKDADETASRRNDPWGYYSRAHALAGGKTWYQAFSKLAPAALPAYMAKHSAKIAQARNAAIAVKLLKAGATEITSLEGAHTNDGFQGLFCIRTEAGIKRISVQIILAGGYNIQCLHQRTLVNLLKGA